MLKRIFEQMKDFARFTQEDARVLAELRPVLEGSFDGAVDEVLTGIQATWGVKTLEEDQLRARAGLTSWLRALFDGGAYDAEYLRRRVSFSDGHLEADVPKHLIFAAMSLLRNTLVDAVQRHGGPAVNQRIHTLNKFLDLELGLLLEDYWEDLVAQVTQSERQRVEYHLREARHLATVGELAASLAHEIKNPLAGISGAMQVISKSMDASHPHRAIVDEILLQIERLDSAVKDLLIFAKPTPPRLRKYSLGDIIHHVMRLMAEAPALKKVPITCQLPDEPLYVMVDSGQMQEVLANLLLNAAHACREKGAIFVSAERSGDEVELTVRDTGQGMTSDVRSRAFEPFFTTKARGTGLGLSICRKAMEAHNGAIELQSEPAKGATVCLRLPCPPPDKEQTAETPAT